jgi:hypothetical protein
MLAREMNGRVRCAEKHTSDARTTRLCIDFAMVLWARIIEHRKGENERSF